MASSSSLAELLTQLLAEGKNCIGEILLGSDFSLRHRSDQVTDASQLKSYYYPEAAREIARYDAKGNYRPLKTAPSLQRGWLLQLKNINEVVLALDFFYPAALSLFEAWRQKSLETTSLRETLGRQSGMYRVTQKLSEEEANHLLQKTCCEGCLRNILWPVDLLHDSATNADGCVAPHPFSNLDNKEIPLLCREACNLLVAAARKVVKKEKS